ncbi:hypothetical protein OEB99_18375 [Actinotalea sp. M2MS4P-6]|uniref:hypothetical protein n=1 Tax=Actinotalea sp. M2MS4P-6 TaxID=2983762 RepID=UPI0021E428A8|nr:hypothetical protein [Actinotalea sp. M2MS4P-6]MCV2396281.1 hypothetical protein [Actinotalea sp. M2MS4P-6]
MTRRRCDIDATTLWLAAVTGLLWLAAVVCAVWLVLAGRGRAVDDPPEPAVLAAAPREPIPMPVWHPQALAFPPSQPGPRYGWSETGR